jgi:hypothetical protein
MPQGIRHFASVPTAGADQLLQTHYNALQSRLQFAVRMQFRCNEIDGPVEQDVGTRSVKMLTHWRSWL